MSRDITIVVEHVAGKTFRAILFEHEDSHRQVFDIIEGNAADLAGHLRHRKKQDGMDWNATVSARWTWWAGRASRFDVLVTRALQAFRMPEGDA